jgi:hypothetical protein
VRLEEPGYSDPEMTPRPLLGGSGVFEVAYCLSPAALKAFLRSVKACIRLTRCPET